MLIAALQGCDFFTWLDTHPSTVDEIAQHFGFHPRPVDVMTTYFVARGLLESARRNASTDARGPRASRRVVRSGSSGRIFRS